MSEMDPETGEGFDAVQVGDQVYFDPNAHDETYPGSTGLEIRKKTYWQGDVQFDTYETVGPKFGPKWPDGTLRVSGLGTDTDVWGLTDKAPPPPGYAPWLHNGVNGQPQNSGIYISSGTGGPPGVVDIGDGGLHEWTPCYEDDGSPTMGDYSGRFFMDITLLGAYGGDIKFPVMPEEFGADFTHEYWTPRVIGLGEIIMPGGQSMETISWDSFFPANYDADYVSVAPTELEDPKSLTARLIWTMRFKMNCMLLVGGGIWNDQVVITNFNYRHKAGEIDDIYYTITLKRYRAPVVSTSPNPDSLKDRWYKDPRQGDTGTATPSGTDPGTSESPPPEDANPDAVIPLPDPVVVPPEDHTGGRDSMISIETTTVLGQPKKDIRQPGGPHEAFSETFAQVVARVSSKGPNDMAAMLALNQWVTDNEYNPYTSQLPVGSGVRYYLQQPAASAPTTTLQPSTSTSLSGAYPGGYLYPPKPPEGTPSHGSPIETAWDWLNQRPDPSTVQPQTNVPANKPIELPQSPIRR